MSKKISFFHKKTKKQKRTNLKKFKETNVVKQELTHCFQQIDKDVNQCFSYEVFEIKKMLKLGGLSWI